VDVRAGTLAHELRDTPSLPVRKSGELSDGGKGKNPGRGEEE